MLIFVTAGINAQVISNTGAAITVTGAVVNSRDLENTSGVLGNDGTINLDGFLFNGGSVSGNGFYNLKGNWTNNGSFSAGTSTVTLLGTSDQTINNNSTGETFYNLTLDNPGVVTQIANPGSTLGVMKDLSLNMGVLDLHSTTVNLSVGGKATLNGSLLFNGATTQTTTIGEILSGSGTIDMSGGSLSHILNLAGATNNIGNFVTSPAGASTVNYNGNNQTVFAAPNYRNLIISNTGVKVLQGDSHVGIDLNITGGTFDLGTTATTVGVSGTTSITGSLSFNGTTTKTVSLANNLSGTGSINMSGGNLPHLLNLDGALNSIGIFNTSLSGSSTVDYRNGNQTMFISDNYRNLRISGGGVKTIYDDITASGVLTMVSGNIDVNDNTLKISNSAVAAIVRTSGTVIGKLQRAIGATGSEYLYPLGTASFYNPMKMTFMNLAGGPLTAQFIPEYIGSAGLPVDDDGNEIYDTYTAGYWSLTSVSPMSTADYNVNLDFDGFSGVDLSASIIKRTDGGDLVTDGEHGAVTGSEISRTDLDDGISVITTDLAIGRGRPRITDQPDNIDICEGSNAFFEVNARGRGTLTYQWQVKINSVALFTNISNGGVYSGANTDRLVITGAPYSMNGYLYRCIITDGQGHPNTTNSALLSVNKIPVAVAAPVAQDVCTGVAFTDIVLGTANDVPGTSFAWNFTTPAGITTTLPTTGVTYDKISGTFNNSTNAPITVTIRIVPTGPGTTYCVGEPIFVTVTVNPTPRVFALPASSIQCDSTTTSIRLTSPSTFTTGSISFRYTVTTTGSVSGFSTPVTGLSNEHYITDNLVNHTDSYQTVTYRIVPISPTGCADGPPTIATVTVNPTPRAIPVNVNPAICYGGTTEIILRSPTVMTSGTIQFDYTVSFTGVPGDVVGNSADGYNLSAEDKLQFSYTNSAPPERMDTVSSVLFSIRPKVSGLACNAGNIVTEEVQVHPRTIKYNYPGTNGKGILITQPLTCVTSELTAGLGAMKVILTRGADPYIVNWTGPVGYTNDSVEITHLNSGKYTVKVSDYLGCGIDSSYVSIAAVTAKPQILPRIILPNIHVSCNGGNNGEMTIFVAAGITAPYFYELTRNGTETITSGVFTGNVNLSDPGTYEMLTGLSAGSYTLLIRDVNGCEVPITTLMNEPAPITAGFETSDFGGFNISCLGYNNGSALVVPSGGNGGYTYYWYAATGIPLEVSNTTNLLDSVAAGKYYVTITDQLGCMKTESITLTEPSGMQLAGSELSLSNDGITNISCNGGSDGFIKIEISGGSGVYNYLWSGPEGFSATTKDIHDLKAGEYTCVVTDLNGCILVPNLSYILTEPDVLAVSSISSVSADGGYNINCNGGTGSAAVTVNGGVAGTYQYNWSSDDGSGIVAGQEDQPALTAGTYALLVTDINGCSTSTEITLSEPPPMEIQLVGTDISCISAGFNNGSVNLTVAGGVAPYSYVWSNGAGSEDISGLTEGEYSVTVTDINGCSRTGSVRINLPPPLTYTSVLSDFNGYNISCYESVDGSIEITMTSGLAPFTYLWTGPDGFTASTKDISSLKAGEYVLLITDSNYCTATEVFELTEPGRLGMVITLSESNAGNFNINCAGANTGFIGLEPVNSVNNVSYLWSDGIFGKTRMNLTAGDYSVVLTDDNNCRVSETITLTEPDSIKIVFDVSPPFCPDMPDGQIRLNVSGGVPGTDYAYKWSDNSTAATISDILKGYYKVVVSDLNGCLAKDSVKVEPLHESCLIIPNAISPNDDLINDVWNIGMIELYPEIEIKIFNRWGETVWSSEKGYPKPWDGRSNGADLPIDSYHYIINLHNGTRPIIGTITIVK
jgi:gliding motility-associated-like protein